MWMWKGTSIDILIKKFSNDIIACFKTQNRTKNKWAKYWIYSSNIFDIKKHCNPLDFLCEQVQCIQLNHIWIERTDKKAPNQKETNNSNNKNKTTTKIETFIRFNIAIMYDIKFYYYGRCGPPYFPFSFAVYPRLLSTAIVQKKTLFNSRHSRSRVLHIKWSHWCVMCMCMIKNTSSFSHTRFDRAPKLIFRVNFHLLNRPYSIGGGGGVPQLISKNWMRLRFHKFCITSARSQALALIRCWPSVNLWCRNQFQLRTTKIIWFYCNSTIKLQ